jgi:hypothetical protein
VDRIWTAIEKVVEMLDLSFDNVRLYQDGLPVCGCEMDIVADLAEGGSRNHRLLVRMIRKGALLVGTESAELLLEEYSLIKQTVSGQVENKALENPEALNRKADILLKKRDAFIARRISSTLGPGETGIVFLGMLHNLVGLVDSDIQFNFPIIKPFSHREIEDEHKG